MHRPNCLPRIVAHCPVQKRGSPVSALHHPSDASIHPGAAMAQVDIPRFEPIGNVNRRRLLIQRGGQFQAQIEVVAVGAEVKRFYPSIGCLHGPCGDGREHHACVSPVVWEKRACLQMRRNRVPGWTVAGLAPPAGYRHIQFRRIGNAPRRVRFLQITTENPIVHGILVGCVPVRVPPEPIAPFGDIKRFLSLFAPTTFPPFDIGARPFQQAPRQVVLWVADPRGQVGAYPRPGSKPRQHALGRETADVFPDGDGLQLFVLAEA